MTPCQQNVLFFPRAKQPSLFPPAPGLTLGVLPSVAVRSAGSIPCGWVLPSPWFLQGLQSRCGVSRSQAGQTRDGLVSRELWLWLRACSERRRRQSCQTGCPACGVKQGNGESLGQKQARNRQSPALSAAWVRLSKLSGSSSQQKAVPSQSTAQPARSSGSARAAGQAKPRTELILCFRNTFSPPKLVWKLDTRKRGGSSQERAVPPSGVAVLALGVTTLCFHVQLPTACCR